MTSKWICVLLVGVVGVALYAGNVLATPSSGVTTTILGKALFDEIDIKTHTRSADHWQARFKTHGLSDAYVVDNKFAPGSTTGWHSHPGPSLVLVVAGTLTNYSSDDETCAPHVYTAGQSFIDPGGTDAHMVRNEGSVLAEDIAVQFLPKDAVRKTDAAAPEGCPS
jgi:quercetin dioxygenase-like cupin family protein